MSWANNAVDSMTIGDPQGAHIYIGDGAITLYDVDGSTVLAQWNTRVIPEMTTQRVAFPRTAGANPRAAEINTATGAVLDVLGSVYDQYAATLVGLLAVEDAADPSSYHGTALTLGTETWNGGPSTVAGMITLHNALLNAGRYLALNGTSTGSRLNAWTNVRLIPGGNDKMTLEDLGEAASRDTLQVGAGPAGAYYAEAFDWTETLVNGTPKNLTPAGLIRRSSDYGTGWAGNVWTCPETGWYRWTVNTTTFVGSYVGSLRLFLGGAMVANVGSNATATDWPAHANIAYESWITAGQTVVVQMYQVSGANRAVDAKLSVARCL